MELLIVFGQSLAIFVFLVILISGMGRKLMSGLTPYEYLIVALLGSAVETGLYHGSDRLSAGIVSAATIFLANYATCRLMTRYPRLRRLMAGGPIVLVHDGQVLRSRLLQVRMTENDLRAAIRKRGYDNLDDIRLAVMEINGEVGVIPKRKSQGSSPHGRPSLSG